MKTKNTLFAVLFALALALGMQNASYAAGPTAKPAPPIAGCPSCGGGG